MNIKLRTIIDGPGSARFNMAADFYLLNSGSDSEVTLRIYRWLCPTVSIGYMQSPEKILNLELMKKDGVGWIKRITGGRGVFHKGDITYSVIFSNRQEFMGGTVSETYRLISHCLMSGLRLSGIESGAHDSSINTANMKKDAGLPCFLSPNRDEIMVDGKKLIGSAQKRTLRGLLQHGSIPVTGDFRELPVYQNISRGEQKLQKRLLKQKCACINELKSGLSSDSLINSLVKAFSDTLNTDYEIRAWTEKERNEIELSMKNLKN